MVLIFIKMLPAQAFEIFNKIFIKILKLFPIPPPDSFPKISHTQANTY